MISRRFLLIFLSVISFLVCAFGIVPASANPLRLHMLDVGYADAIIIEAPDGSTMMIDAGTGESSPKIIDYLHQHGIETVDHAVITHPHQNHFGGFLALTARIPVRHFYVNGDERAEDGYGDLLENIEVNRIPLSVLKKGDTLKVRGMQVTALHPDSFDANVNASSLVLYVVYKDIKILLAADIEPAQQDSLLAEYPFLKEAQLVKIPHHGGPLSENFIRLMQDKIFLVSTGTNPWGLPLEEQLQQLQGTVYRTDKQGNIVVETDGYHIMVKYDQ